MNNFDRFIERKQREFGTKFDASDLAQKFVPYFNSKERIKVGMNFDTKTGTIGVTSGWKPVFLLMRTSRSISSPIILNENNQILAVKRGRNYAKV